MHRPIEPSTQHPVCTLPPEQCPVPGDVCDSDCWTQETAPVCPGTERCVIVPCNEPLVTDCMGPCDTTCDQWMDWLACDGTTCFVPPSEKGCKQCSSALELTGSPEVDISNTDGSTNVPLQHILNNQPSVLLLQNSMPHHQHTNQESRATAEQNAWGHPPSNQGVLSQAAGPSHHIHCPPYPSPSLNIPTFSSHPHPAQKPPSDRIVCLWGACRDTFSSQTDLVAHVNVVHLGVDPLSMTPTSNIRERDALACHWANCSIQLPPAPRCPTETEPEYLSMLASHLLQDHLGLRPSTDLELLLASLAPSTDLAQEMVTPDLVGNDAFGALSSTSSHTTLIPQVTGTSQASNGSRASTKTPAPFSQLLALPDRSQTTNASSSGASPPSSKPTSSDPPSSHVCRWTACGRTFENVDTLSAHILANHVGSGKREYSCHWGDCNRSGTKAFTSKQKILRHLQAHTGQKPFQCKVCGQHFSEAATLQQHMRRHTSEKPFVCDFPGCEKSFAVAGALTIHKRMHTGAKPFKCTYCDKAFSESSNLSKHIRTHTGDKPYACLEPGCNKRFCRPDQLNRHRIVHTKKGAQNNEVVEESDADMNIAME
ncbi:zinc-finger protein [Tulasnella sp. JGI-2019a]|nr:zinc-finger protein [Tulasnella sp. JGI-2019a]